MILVVGANGSMGKRYQAILRYLGEKVLCADISDYPNSIVEMASVCDGAIIATPTETHLDQISLLAGAGVKCPILCEKPLSKDMGSVQAINRIVTHNKLNFTMTMQYKMLDDLNSSGPSYYDFFRHGSDGLIWDCIQIIGLSRDELELHETSPIWKCQLNGKQLSLGDMDKAYVDFVSQWLENPVGDDIHRLSALHHKTKEMSENWKD